MEVQKADIAPNFYELQRYRKKRIAREKRLQVYKNSEEIKKQIEWIVKIQQNSGLNMRQFAAKLGVSFQTFRLWKYNQGHLPSKRSLKRLRYIERMQNIKVTTIKLDFGVKI